MAHPDSLTKLIETFDRNIEAYKSGGYNEAQVRLEFINPFFSLLGWDIDNKQGYAEAYKEVINEDAIKVGGSTKAPDYSFRVGGSRKFFLEAKKPAVSIKDDGDPAFQLRRYAWSAKLPISILTNFAEFAVYDCRVKPVKNDKASTARILYFKYSDYPEHWDEISGIFSKDAVLKGSFDKYAVSHKHKKGTATVDNAFLEEIEDWRGLLAKNIALRNPKLTQRHLNFAVEKTIDRIIFLRICEDRGIEDYGRIQAHLNGTQVYRRMTKLFREADEKYNSGLFHFHEEKDRNAPPDGLTLELDIDDKPLKEIIGRLYYPESPYEFSVFPPEILGQVYEQFLGKVIRLTAGHHAVVEDKPEVRKAGGVYYTPAYIVDYIVKNTVGKLLEDKKPGPRSAGKLKILDPACGSGSFLLGAYQYLLDWHRDKYVEEGAEKHKKELYKGYGGEWRLTIAERKRILLDNIFGVDIDVQAVEVTKLSLLLKVLEGESGEALRRQLKLFQDRALPDLDDNIKCGNSLIGPDFYEHTQGNLFVEEEEQYRINAFDWQAAFPEIMKPGGFDAVIGNPPYVRQEILGEKFKEYVARHYFVYAGTADLYAYFIEKSHKVLCSDGYFGMICSNKFMRANYGKALRSFLAEKATLRQIVDFGELPVFQNAATFPVIILTKNKKTKEQKFTYAPIKRLDFISLKEEVTSVGMKLDSRSLSGDNWTLASGEEVTIIEKMKLSASPLGEYVQGKIYRGVLTGLNEAFVIDKEIRKQLIKDDPKSKELIKPFAVGDNIRKYRIESKQKYLIFTRRGTDIKNYPAIEKHLAQFKTQLQPKPKNDKSAREGRKPGNYKWYEIQDTVDYYAEFEKPKIIFPDIAKESRMAFDEFKIYMGNTGYIIPVKDLYLLGVLNSKLIFTFYKRIATVIGDADKGGRLRWIYQDVIKLPIRVIDFSDSKDKTRHGKMVELVERMLDLNKKLPELKTPHEKTVLQNQIDATDKQIDKLVYELYSLTDDEIAIVEGN